MIGSKRLLLFGGGPHILFSGTQVLAAATVGTAVGTATVRRGKGMPQYTLPTDAGGKYLIDVNTGVVNVNAALSNGTDTIVIHVTGMTPNPLDLTCSIIVGAAAGVTGAPGITGTAIAGLTLTATSGTLSWSGSPTPTVAYQWKRATVAIPGATSSTYVLVAADATNTITVEATGSNVFGSAAATSSPTSAVTKTTLSYTPNTSATQGTAYTGATPGAPSGGTSPYTYSINTAALPTGLTFDTSTGIISGTPTTVAAYAGLVLTVADANGVTDASSPFTITVSAPAAGTSGEAIGLLLILTKAA